MPAAIESVAERLAQSPEVLVITGAGISAESGLPTFRGEGGYWRTIKAETLATRAAFEADPKRVWEWYAHRRLLIAQAKPNAAHRALAALERSGKGVFIITQNIDDLHERAGSREVVHVHGTLLEALCPAENRIMPLSPARLESLPLRCPCGGLLRPNVVWFDEELPAAAVDAIERYYNRRRPGVVLVVGTEATFDYIRDYAIRARHNGAVLVEINPSETPLTGAADFSLRLPAGEALPRLVGRTEGTDELASDRTSRTDVGR